MLWNTLCAEQYQILRKAVPAKGGGGGGGGKKG